MDVKGEKMALIRIKGKITREGTQSVQNVNIR